MLNDAKLRKLKAKDKPYKEHDNGGLYAYISTKGAILFRADYSFQGKRKTIALGEYPHLSLAKAIAKLTEIKEGLIDGIDPMEAKKRNNKPKLKKLKIRLNLSPMNGLTVNSTIKVQSIFKV